MRRVKGSVTHTNRRLYWYDRCRGIEPRLTCNIPFSGLGLSDPASAPIPMLPVCMSASSGSTFRLRRYSDCMTALSRRCGSATPGALQLRPRRFASLCACLRPLVVWRPSTSASLKRFAHRRGGVEPPDTRLWVKSSPANVIGTAMTVSEGWKKHPNTRRLTFSAAASTCLLRAAVALCPPLHETQNR